jgi:hypothetical protein
MLVLGRPGLRQAAAVERDDVFMRSREGAPLGHRQAAGRGRQLGGLHPEIAGLQLGAIKFCGVVADRLVTPFINGGQNRGDAGGEFPRHGAAPAKRRKIFRKSPGGDGERAHWEGFGEGK